MNTIVIPTYKEIKRKKFWRHFWIIIGLICMGYASIDGSVILLVIWGLSIGMDILTLKRLDFKTKIRDSLKLAYEKDNNVTLTREEFDNIFKESSSVEKEQD